MNLAYEYNAQGCELSDYQRGGKEKLRASRRPSHARDNGRPAVHNGIHRRRKKRFGW